MLSQIKVNNQIVTSVDSSVILNSSNLVNNAGVYDYVFDSLLNIDKPFYSASYEVSTSFSPLDEISINLKQGDSIICRITSDYDIGTPGLRLYCNVI